MKPKVLFRVDANITTGTGHFFRCYALAQAIKGCGFQSIFVGNVNGILLEEMLEKENFQFWRWQEELSELKTDAEETIKIIESENIISVIVDNKKLDFRWERMIRPRVRTLAAIDDTPSRKYDLDVLVSPNMYLEGARPFSGLVPEGCEVFLGPSSLPLRSEFNTQHKLRDQDRPTKRIGSFFGGADPRNQSGMILELARLPEFSHLEFDVVSGPLNPMNVEMFKTASKLSNVRFRTDISDMASFWTEIDVAFGSYGVSTWERCALGVATISTVQSEEQVFVSEELARLGAVFNLGKIEDIQLLDYCQALRLLLSDNHLVQTIRRNASLVMSRKENSAARLLETLTQTLNQG